MPSTKSELQNPVETEVTEVILTSVTEKFAIDITDTLVAFDVNESINTRVLTGSMTIVDAVGMLSNLPITGQEKIELKIQKGPVGKGKKEWEKELTFFVRSVENVERANDFTMEYQLQIVEESYFLNALTLVSQAYTGTINSIMMDLAEEHLQIEKFTVDATAGTFKVIIPNWRPFAAMKWLTRRARTDANEPFFCYNTLFEGMHLKSVRSIYDSVPINDRTLYLQKEHIPQSKEEAQKGAIEDIPHKADMAFYYKALEATPIAQHIMNGVYGSRYRLLNTSNKVVEEKVWNYRDEFEELPKLSKFKVASDKKKYKELGISDYISSEFLFVFSGDAHASPSHMTYNEDTLNNVPFKNANDQHLGNYSYKLGVPGDKEIQVGKTINLHLEKNEMVQRKKQFETKDERRSGKHVITSIKHRFNLKQKAYTQMIELNRDSMERDHDHEN